MLRSPRSSEHITARGPPEVETSSGWQDRAVCAFPSPAPNCSGPPDWNVCELGVALVLGRWRLVVGNDKTAAGTGAAPRLHGLQFYGQRGEEPAAWMPTSDWRVTASSGGGPERLLDADMSTYWGPAVLPHPQAHGVVHA